MTYKQAIAQKPHPYIYSILKSNTSPIQGNYEPEMVVSYVCQEYGITTRAVRAKNRHRDIVEARQIICLILNKEVGIAKNKISKILNYADHTTVLHSLQAIQNKIDTEDELKERVRVLTIDALEYSTIQSA